MAKYSYDDSGVYFAFFIVSVLSLVLLPATIRLVRPGAPAFKHASTCQCSLCRSKYAVNRKRDASRTRAWRLFKTLLILSGWSAVGYLGYVIYSTELEVPEQWDPWKVLGLSSSATKSEAKKAFYRLSLIHHPDKVAEDLKEAAAKIFGEMSKAYKVLTNDDARKAFEEWGHPDGKQAFSMGIALPASIVAAHNSPFVLLAYFAVFGVFLPYRIGRWWYLTRRFTKDGVLSKTMGILFRRVEEDANPKSLLVTLARAAEFGDKDSELPYRGAKDDALVRDLEAKVQAAFQAIGEDWNAKRDLHGVISDSPAARKALIMVLAHLTRPASYTPDAHADRTVAKYVHLLQRGTLPIILARGWLVPALYSMDVTQLLAQGMWHGRSPILQVPHVTLAHVRSLAQREPAVKSLQDFADMAEDERRKALKDLTEEQIKDVQCFLDAFPRIVLEKLDFKVVGEESITPGSLVTCTLRMRLAPLSTSLESIKQEYEAKKAAKAEARKLAGKPPAEDSDDEGDDDVDALGLEGEGDGGRSGKAALQAGLGGLQSMVKLNHSPRFPLDKRPTWRVFIGNLQANRIITTSHIKDLQERTTCKLQFQAPPQPGTYPFSLFVKSDHWVGADMRLDVQMTVEPPTEAQLAKLQREAAGADDISDPDEDTLAGQMAVLRGQRTKQAALEEEEAAGNGGDSESSSDSDSDSDDE